jgi:hypothetical protein
MPAIKHNANCSDACNCCSIAASHIPSV